jgi:hypothetical protein
VEAASGREIAGLDGGSIFSALSLAPDGKSLVAGDSSLRREGRLQRENACVSLKSRV